MTRDTVRLLSAAANQGDGHEKSALTAHQGGARLKDKTKSSTRKKGNSTKKTGAAIESEFESDTNSVLDNQSLGLGLVGLTNASANGSPYDPEVQHMIPCRYNDRGCKEVFPDLTLADIHARAFHGEGPPHHPQQQPAGVLQHQLSLRSDTTRPNLSIPCSVCPALFVTTQQMLTHVFSSHQQAAEQLRQSFGVAPPVSPTNTMSAPTWPPMNTASSETVLSVKCVLCAASLPSEHDLVNHLNQAHGLPRGAPPSQSFHAPFSLQQPHNPSSQQP